MATLTISNTLRNILKIQNKIIIDNYSCQNTLIKKPMHQYVTKAILNKQTTHLNDKKSKLSQCWTMHLTIISFYSLKHDPPCEVWCSPCISLETPFIHWTKVSDSVAYSLTESRTSKIICQRNIWLSNILSDSNINVDHAKN